MKHWWRRMVWKMKKAVKVVREPDEDDEEEDSQVVICPSCGEEVYDIICPVCGYVFLE